DQQGPLPEVEQKTVDETGRRAVEAEHADGPGRDRASSYPSQVSGAHADPAGGQHLVRQPWPQAGREHRRQEERQGASGESEARAHDEPARDDQEKDGRKAEQSDDDDEPQGGIDRNQRCEHREQPRREAMGLERDPQHDQGGHRDQRAEEHDRLRKSLSEEEGTDEEREPGPGEPEQERIFAPCDEPSAQSGTSSGRSQPPPTSLLIWVAKTRESLNTAVGGPSA